MSIDIAIKKRAIKLRLAGYSYHQIQRELALASKGTLSAWFRNLRLPTESQALLKKNIERATKHGLLEFNRTRSKRIQEENEVALRTGVQSIGKLSERELLLLGAALYWGEGTKYERKNGTISLVFTNSDAEMIRVFIRFLRQILKVSENRIRAGIHMYSKALSDVSGARAYWSKISLLPKDRFYISQLVSGASSGKRDKHRLPHGTLSIRVNDRKIFFKIKGMIRGLIIGT